MSKKEQGAHSAGKSNNPREGNGYHSGRPLPKPETVREVEVKSASDARKKQYEPSGVRPMGRDYPTKVCTSK